MGAGCKTKQDNSDIKNLFVRYWEAMEQKCGKYWTKIRQIAVWKRPERRQKKERGARRVNKKAGLQHHTWLQKNQATLPKTQGAMEKYGWPRKIIPTNSSTTIGRPLLCVNLQFVTRVIRVTPCVFPMMVSRTQNAQNALPKLAFVLGSEFLG